MPKPETFSSLMAHVERWAKDAGFDAVGVASADLHDQEERLKRWLDSRYHGSMHWLERHADMRLEPALLQPGATRVISFRMNYLPSATDQIAVLKDPRRAYVSRYALGRDYHKLIRKRLAKIAENIRAYCTSEQIDPSPNQRAFVDSAPILERPLAARAGLGWVGKHTLLIHPSEGSWFFLGEILTNLPLPLDQPPVENRCGDCRACLQVCPTDAFPEPYVLDARRCISYLTIENKGPIPLEFREPMGNRVFGCDDCQAICPWNKYAKRSAVPDFSPRHALDNSDLVDLFRWSEAEFLQKTEGSPLRRIGYDNWRRNLAVALGNAKPDSEAIALLKNAITEEGTDWRREHFEWALDRQKTPPLRRKRKIKNPR